MDNSTVKLTVFFEDPFWVGVFERIEGGRLSAAKVTFGAEPRDYEVYEFILRNYYRLRFSPTVEAASAAHKLNPKRMQREVKRQLEGAGVGTKSQQALKLQQEQCKTERRLITRQQREQATQRKYELRQQKKREKHRGR